MTAEDLARAQRGLVDRATPMATPSTMRKAIVTATSPLTISMNGVSITDVPRLPNYYPVVNDVVLVLMDGAAPLIVSRVSPAGPYVYTPSLSYSGGGGSFGSGFLLSGEWDYDGSRIVGQAFGVWGSSPSGGTGNFQVSSPVSGAMVIGAATSQAPMVGSGFLYDNDTGSLKPIIVRLVSPTIFWIYRSGVETTSFTMTGTVPITPGVGDSFFFNFAYRPA